MEEPIWRKYKLNALENKVLQIMNAADVGDDRLYGRLGAELICEISSKVDEVIADLTAPTDTPVKE